MGRREHALDVGVEVANVSGETFVVRVGRPWRAFVQRVIDEDGCRLRSETGLHDRVVVGAVAVLRGHQSSFPNESTEWRTAHLVGVDEDEIESRGLPRQHRKILQRVANPRVNLSPHSCLLPPRRSLLNEVRLQLECSDPFYSRDEGKSESGRAVEAANFEDPLRAGHAGQLLKYDSFVGTG